MNDLFRAASELIEFCVARDWRCCVIGGLAVQRWGQPRQTRDVDATLLTGLGDEPMFVDALLERYRGRIPNAKAFAIDHRVLLLQTSKQVQIDIALGSLPFEARVIARASTFAFADEIGVATCSAEDLVVFKAFAGRPLDWFDVEGILARQGATLDRNLILTELRELLILKEDPADPESKLLALFSKHRP